MSSTINMTGKPTAGGGGKGGGESKFERLWHQVLRDPNPSTIRTFKELFDVADPSQTLFGGGKGAGTGTAVNDPATKLHRALLNHEAKLQRMIQTAAHTRAGASRVAHQNLNVQRLKGIAAHVGIPLEDTFSTMEGHVGKNYRNWMRDHQSAIRLQRTYAPSGPMNAHVAARDRHLAAQEAQARFNATHPMNSHVAARDKYLASQFASSPAGLGGKYRSGLLTSAIGGAEGAVAVGGLGDFRKQYRVMNKLEKSAERQVALLTSMNRTDDKELSLAQQHLAQVKSAKSHYASMGQARWGNGATRYTGPGISGYMEAALGGSVLADILDPMAIGATAAIGGALAAYKFTNVLGSAIGAEKPYVNARLGASRLSGQFGYGTGSKALLDQFYAKSKVAKGWMSRYGITTTGAEKMLSDYGITGGSAQGSAGIVKQLRYAQAFMPFLRGMSDAQLGGVSRQAVISGISSNTNLQPILHQYQEVIAAGTAAGVDRASSLKALSGSINVLANSMGFGGSNGNRLAAIVSGMMMSGIPSMRSGAGEAQTFGGMEKALHGAVHSPARLTMLYQWMLAKNGGKSLPVGSQLGHVFGESWYKNASGKPGEKYIIDEYDKLAKKSPVLALQYLDKILPSQTLLHIGRSFGNELGLHGTGYGAALARSIAGVTVPGQAALSVAKHASKYAKIMLARERPYLPDLTTAAKAYNVPVGYLAGAWAAEGGGQLHAHYKGYGARGPFQFEKSTWASLTKLPYSDASNIRIASLMAAKLAAERKKAGWNMDDWNSGKGLAAFGGSESVQSTYRFHLNSVAAALGATPAESAFRKSAYAQAANQGNAVIKRSKDMFDATNGLILNFQGLNNSALDLAGNFTALGNALNKTLLTLEGVGKKPKVVHTPKNAWDVLSSPNASLGAMVP